MRVTHVHLKYMLYCVFLIYIYFVYFESNALKYLTQGKSLYSLFYKFFFFKWISQFVVSNKVGVRICYQLSCSNLCKMHTCQVVIWWKIQYWQNFFYLNTSLDKCLSEVMTHVHFCRNCCNLVYSKSLPKKLWVVQLLLYDLPLISC